VIAAASRANDHGVSIPTVQTPPSGPPILACLLVYVGLAGGRLFTASSHLGVGGCADLARPGGPRCRSFLVPTGERPRLVLCWHPSATGAAPVVSALIGSDQHSCRAPLGSHVVRARRLARRACGSLPERVVDTLHLFAQMLSPCSDLSAVAREVREPGSTERIAAWSSRSSRRRLLSMQPGLFATLAALLRGSSPEQLVPLIDGARHGCGSGICTAPAGTRPSRDLHVLSWLWGRGDLARSPFLGHRRNWTPPS